MESGHSSAKRTKVALPIETPKSEGEPLFQIIS